MTSLKYQLDATFYRKMENDFRDRRTPSGRKFSRKPLAPSLRPEFKIYLLPITADMSPVNVNLV